MSAEVSSAGWSNSLARIISKQGQPVRCGFTREPSDTEVLYDKDHDDLIYGGSGSLLFVGGAGPSTVLGGRGSVTVFGSTYGTGTMFASGGSDGNNLLIADVGKATLVGGGGGDTLFAAGSQAQLLRRWEGDSRRWRSGRLDHHRARAAQTLGHQV